MARWQRLSPETLKAALDARPTSTEGNSQQSHVPGVYPYTAPLPTLADLLRLTPTQFEHQIAELMRALGYLDVQRTGGRGDLAVDVVCRTPDNRYKVVVQCKRYLPGHPISSPEVQKFIGMMTVHHQAQRGVFVTTSTYTRPSQTLGQKHNLRMIDGDQLITYIHRIQKQRWETWRESAEW